MLVKWRIFVVSAVCLGAMVLGVCFQALELREHYLDRQERLQEQGSRLSRLKELQEQHPDLERYQMEIEAQRKRTDQLLPDAMNMAGLLPQLQKNILKSGLELRELLPGEIARENGVSAQPLQVKVEGDYFGLLEFIRAMENGAPLCQVSAMELQQKGNVLSAKLQLNVFSL